MAKRQYRKKKRKPRKTFRLMRQMASVNYCKMKLHLNSEIVTTATSPNLVNASIAPRSMSFNYSPDSGTPTTHFSLNNFQKVKDMWDEYRTYYCVIRYRPYTVRNDDFTTVLPQVVVAFDKDNNGFFGIDSLRSKKGSKLFDLGRAWTFKQGIPRYNDSNTNTAGAEGWQNLQNEGTEANRSGIIGIVSKNPLFPAPTAPVILGEVDIDIYMELRSRQDSNVRAYYGVDKQKNEVITDLQPSNLSHDDFKASVPPLENTDGLHPF